MITDLGTLGGSQSTAVAANDQGQIAGSSTDAANEWRAFLWKSGKMTDLGTLPGRKHCFASALNSRGAIAGYCSAELDEFGRSFGSHAFLWREGKMTDLGTLGGEESEAAAINDRGQVVGWAEPPANEFIAPSWIDPRQVDVRHAFLWQNGVMTDLGTLGGPASEAIAVNSWGQVVGWSETTDTTANAMEWRTRAFLWQNGEMRDLGLLPIDGDPGAWGPGAPEAMASGINDRNQVVGTSDTRRFTAHAFLWQGGTMIDLGTLGGKRSHPADMSERGKIVGESELPGGAWHAYLWQNGRMIDLGTLGGMQSRAASINERGQIVGSSQTPSGLAHAFVWRGGAMTDLGVPDRYDWAEAVAISRGALIVGNAGRGEAAQEAWWFEPDQQHAVLWTPKR